MDTNTIAIVSLVIAIICVLWIIFHIMFNRGWVDKTRYISRSRGWFTGGEGETPMSGTDDWIYDIGDDY